MKEKSIEYEKVNLLALPIIIVISIIFGILYKVIISDTSEIIDGLNLIIIIPAFILFVFMHEFIHAIFIAKYTKKGFKAVKFGMNWKGLAPYCNCKEALSVKKFRIVTIMPTVILGFLPLIIGFLINNINLIIIGLFMTIGGIGDLILLWMLRDIKKDTLIYEHLTKLGFMYKDKKNEDTDERKDN